MTRFPARWSDLATTDFADRALADAIAILPVASIEQHGPHLPLGTDTYINGGILDAAGPYLAAGPPAIILPTQAIGTSHEHLGFPGTLTIPGDELIRAWTRQGEGVHRAGLRKLLIFNSHGGQTGLTEIVAVDLRARLGMVVAWSSPGAFGLPDGVAIDPIEAAHGLHGGLKETSMMLHLRPDLVRMDQAAGFGSSGAEMVRSFVHLRETGRTGYGWQAQDLNAAGVVGDATAASAALGARLVDHAARGLAALVADLAKFELPGR